VRDRATADEYRVADHVMMRRDDVWNRPRGVGGRRAVLHDHHRDRHREQSQERDDERIVGSTHAGAT
jgi:hypothetical protein